MDEHDRDMWNEVAAGERWLDDLSGRTPPPSPECLRRVRQSVSAELGELHAATAGRRWRAWHGAAAAAAAIALAVTIGWYSAGVTMPAGGLIAGDVPAWSDDTEQGVIVLASMDDELAVLEAWTETADWDMDGTDLYEVFEEISGEMTNGTVDEAGASITWPRWGVQPRTSVVQASRLCLCRLVAQASRPCIHRRDGGATRVCLHRGDSGATRFSERTLNNYNNIEEV